MVGGNSQSLPLCHSQKIGKLFHDVASMTQTKVDMEATHCARYPKERA